MTWKIGSGHEHGTSAGLQALPRDWLRVSLEYRDRWSASLVLRSFGLQTLLVRVAMEAAGCRIGSRTGAGGLRSSRVQISVSCNPHDVGRPWASD